MVAMALVVRSGMQVSSKSRIGIENKEEERAKILLFLEQFLSSSAATSQGSPPHSQPQWKKVCLKTESAMSTSLSSQKCLNPVFTEMKLYNTALLTSSPCLPVFLPSKEKGKKKSRMEESSTAEPNPDLDLIC